MRLACIRQDAVARELADAYGAVRLNPDEWELALDVDPFDEAFQVRLEAQFWELAQRLLVMGTSVVLKWGFWARSEREEKREAARTLGVGVELRFLDVPYEELVRRVVARRAAGGIAITEAHMAQYRGIFQRPTDDELALYDSPLTPIRPYAGRAGTTGGLAPIRAGSRTWNRAP